MAKASKEKGKENTELSKTATNEFLENKPETEIIEPSLKEDIQSNIKDKKEVSFGFIGTETPIKEEKPESDEIQFLRLILTIQNDGGWGTHLNGIINERIANLKAK